MRGMVLRSIGMALTALLAGCTVGPSALPPAPTGWADIAWGTSLDELEVRVPDIKADRCFWHGTVRETTITCPTMLGADEVRVTYYVLHRRLEGYALSAARGSGADIAAITRAKFGPGERWQWPTSSASLGQGHLLVFTETYRQAQRADAAERAEAASRKF